jgi:hypothetical protein
MLCTECEKDNPRMPDGKFPKHCIFCGADIYRQWLEARIRYVLSCPSEGSCNFEWDPNVVGRPAPEGMKHCPRCGKELIIIRRDPEENPWSAPFSAEREWSTPEQI